MMSSSDFYFCINITENYFVKDIIQFIDSQKDVMNRTTNVKAKMTDWHVQEEKGFKELSKYILHFAKHISLKKFNVNVNLKIKAMWGMCYTDGDYAVPHDHWPSLWSSTYYINPPEDSPGLYFNDLDEYVFPKNGTLILFPGWVKHEVKKKNFVGNRYVVAANLHETKNGIRY